MKREITVIDYGRSNLLSVQRALEYCGAQVVYASEPQQIAQAQRLILPGVGAFADGMHQLQQKQLIQAIRQAADRGVPLLGICLGMQMLFESSEEDGMHQGLGLVEGNVTAVPTQTVDGQQQKVPHVGWGKLLAEGGSFERSFLQGLSPQDECYFVHSFRAIVRNPQHQVAYTTYGGHNICAAVQKGNIMGTQFHPEKSGQVGLHILQRFIEH